MTISPQRRRLLSSVHIGKKQLGLDDDTWRAVVKRVTGHESCADASDAGLMMLMDELRKLGGQVPSAEPPASFKPAKKAQARLVYALWGALGRMGALKDPSKAALRIFCARQLDLDAATDPDLLTNKQLDPIIRALKAWNDREVQKLADAEIAARKAK